MLGDGLSQVIKSKSIAVIIPNVWPRLWGICRLFRHAQSVKLVRRKIHVPWDTDEGTGSSIDGCSGRKSVEMHRIG